MMRESKKYNSKILLFGEYSILLGSKALAIPYERFSGNLSIESYPGSEKSNATLKLFLKYIQTVQHKLHHKIDVNSLRSDIEQGIHFRSSIPDNYGLGTSGALCAAIYADYGIQPGEDEKNRLDDIRKDLILLETFFHGRHTGNDPLCSYLNKPLLFSQTDIQVTSLRENNKINLFLIDTLKSGNKGELLSFFKQKWEDQGFIYQLMNDYVPLNNECLHDFLQANESLKSNLYDLSYYQLENFSDMIPPGIRSFWKEGLQHDIFSLKLCGSGGGGFMLGFTSNIKETMEYFNLKIIPLLHLNFSF